MQVKLLVPESLSEITLQQYQKFLKISENNEDSIFLQQKMIEIFCNVELKQVLNIKYNSIVEVTNHLNKLFQQKPEFTPRFKRDSIEFGFIPKLDDMTFGEFVDLDTTIADWENIHKAMGVLYRPITISKKNKYQVEQYNSFDKYDMQKMPLDVVMGALFFFWNLSKELIIHIPTFFKEELQNLTLQQKQTLEESGVGIQVFMDLVMDQLQTSHKLQNSLFTNV